VNPVPSSVCCWRFAGSFLLGHRVGNNPASASFSSAALSSIYPLERAFTSQRGCPPTGHASAVVPHTALRAALLPLFGLSLRHPPVVVVCASQVWRQREARFVSLLQAVRCGDSREAQVGPFPHTPLPSPRHHVPLLNHHLRGGASRGAVAHREAQ
jgi:hypothetical protein